MTATTCGEFGPHHSTFAPGPAPRLSSRFASRLDCASSSAYAHVVTVPSSLSSMTASLPGWLSAYTERMSGIALPHECRSGHRMLAAPAFTDNLRNRHRSVNHESEDAVEATGGRGHRRPAAERP